MKKLSAILSTLIFSVLIIGCDDDGPDIDLESSIPVRVEAVTQKPIKEYTFATGTAQAMNESNFNSFQSGLYQVQVNARTGTPFTMGDSVEIGDVIVKLENPEFENQISIKSKSLNYDISKREFEKQKKLFEKGGITLRELTDAERNYIDSKYALENASLQLAKLTAIATFGGIIVDLPFYSENQLLSAGTHLVSFMDYSKMVIDITLPGKEMGRIHKNQKAFITNYNNATDTLDAIITQVSPTLNPETRMFKASLEIDNSSLNFRPGMFVKVDIIVDSKDSTLVIRKDVVQQRRGEKTVYIVDKGVALERVIETGLENNEEIEILSGLEADDRLVIEGFETLRHRSKVRVSK